MFPCSEISESSGDSWFLGTPGSNSGVDFVAFDRDQLWHLRLDDVVPTILSSSSSSPNPATYSRAVALENPASVSASGLDISFKEEVLAPFCSLFLLFRLRPSLLSLSPRLAQLRQLLLPPPSALATETAWQACSAALSIAKLLHGQTGRMRIGEGGAEI